MDSNREKNIRERSKKEIELFDIYLDETTLQLSNRLEPNEILEVASAAFLGASLTDLNNTLELLYDELPKEREKQHVITI
ncbi:hypothetical protein HMPREF9318_00067 [Streptococcus urinalis FB127-CNA-2]|uniref:Uncharacterized protein n=1 Tax=Streptococcus urinalis 2285-97 TaxID=764291 RepID=G5KEH3_9STRE|nr:hypothetical protein [Streptococcus urinalis]QBX22131.1 hypothetical protein Javan637_0023 [Streptococcus phage Javan637]QBX31587.1 hypothetical protein Javan642_0023 [Streptococcus phage Javan642]QBX31668.1 hypothetical protein Javan648_0042 [Streptococcus phage Javan648]EHJ57667.1 hypothetical protein STRUR_0807 [Streptococcus urinalis 2285-97]EKS21869.1 hypothetical protein HMPREF9318_00067 [Streptococcus urinalis FB127-CNA-2]